MSLAPEALHTEVEPGGATIGVGLALQVDGKAIGSEAVDVGQVAALEVTAKGSTPH